MENTEFHDYLAAACRGAGPGQWLEDELQQRLPSSWAYEFSNQRYLVRGFYQGPPSRTVGCLVQSLVFCDAVGWRHVSGGATPRVYDDVCVFEILATTTEPSSAVVIELTLHPTQDDEFTLAAKTMVLGKEGSKRLMASRRKRRTVAD
jgi:hypothetical protein